jgi:hypothetical protein
MFSFVIPAFSPGPANPQDMSEFFFPDHARQKKSRWTPEEDDLLRAAVGEFQQNWPMVARAVPGRSHKQCRERWVSAVDPTLTKGAWAPQEDAVLIRQHQIWGGAWAQIARSLPGRSANAAKNRFVSLSNRFMPLVKHRPQTRHTAPAELLWLMETAQQNPGPAPMSLGEVTRFPDPQDDDNDEMRDFYDWADDGY